MAINSVPSMPRPFTLYPKSQTHLPAITALEASNLPLECTRPSLPMEVPRTKAKAFEARYMQQLSTTGHQRNPIPRPEIGCPREARCGPAVPRSIINLVRARDTAHEDLVAKRRNRHWGARQPQLVCPICECIFFGNTRNSIRAGHIEKLHIIRLGGDRVTGPFQCCKRDFKASTESAVRDHIVEEHA